MLALRARTEKVAWNASSAAWESPNTRLQTPKTKRSCRSTMAVKAVWSRLTTNRCNKELSDRSRGNTEVSTWAVRTSVAPAWSEAGGTIPLLTGRESAAESVGPAGAPWPPEGEFPSDGAMLRSPVSDTVRVLVPEPVRALSPSRRANSPGGAAWPAMFSALRPVSDAGWTGAMEGKGFVGAETGAVVESGNDLGAESALPASDDG